MRAAGASVTCVKGRTWDTWVRLALPEGAAEAGRVPTHGKEEAEQGSQQHALLVAAHEHRASPGLGLHFMDMRVRVGENAQAKN